MNDGRIIAGSPTNFQRRRRLIAVVRELRTRRLQSDLLHRLAEELAIFGLVDGFGFRAYQLDPVTIENTLLVQRQGGVQRRLSAHRREDRVGALFRYDFRDDFRRDRLDIGRVRQLRVRHDRRRIRIHENDPVALGLQSLAGLRSGVVEFACLADDDRTGTDYEDRFDVCAFGHGHKGLAEADADIRPAWGEDSDVGLGGPYRQCSARVKP